MTRQTSTRLRTNRGEATFQPYIEKGSPPKFESLERRAEYDTSERIGEPAWFAALRARLDAALARESPLEALSFLGPPCSGPDPESDSGETVREPASVRLLRIRWERDLTAEDYAPGCELPERPNKLDSAKLRAWRLRLWESLAPANGWGFEPAWPASFGERS